MLETPWPCTILCFLFTNYDWIIHCNVSVGHWIQNDRNAIERCARSGPKKLTKTCNKVFPNHSTLINYMYVLTRFLTHEIVHLPSSLIHLVCPPPPPLSKILRKHCLQFPFGRLLYPGDARRGLKNFKTGRRSKISIKTVLYMVCSCFPSPRRF